MEQREPSQLQLAEAVQSDLDEISEQVGWQKPADHMHRPSALQLSKSLYAYLHCIRQLLPVHEHMDVHMAETEICEQVVVQMPLLTSYMQFVFAVQSLLDDRVLQPPTQALLYHMHWASDEQFAVFEYWAQPLPHIPLTLLHLQLGSVLHEAASA